MHYNKSKMDVNVYNSQKAITMHDIAREAGVSVATVSRFINNDGVSRQRSRNSTIRPTVLQRG